MPETNDTSHEPATEHFTPAELAAFLDQLAFLHPEECAPKAPRSRALRSERVRSGPDTAAALTRVVPAAQETRTVLDRAHLLAVDALPGKTRVVRSRAQQADGSSPRRRPVTSYSARWLLRARPWRRAFVLAALSALLLLLVLSLRALPYAAEATRARKPPSLPAPPAAFVAPSPWRGTGPETWASRASSSTSHGGESGSSVQPSSDAPMQALRAPQQLAARIAASSRPRPAARREAVDLLLSGRSRAALDAYRALLSSWPATAQTEAVAHVVRLLEREQESCTRKPGPSCGT